MVEKKKMSMHECANRIKIDLFYPYMLSIFNP